MVLCVICSSPCLQGLSGGQDLASPSLSLSAVCVCVFMYASYLFLYVSSEFVCASVSIVPMCINTRATTKVCVCVFVV